MPVIETQIDELYQKPLDEFTAARNALAKTLTGGDAQRIRKLAKPTLVPWAVNQLYWHERPVYDRLRKSGERLRAAQIAALKGRAGDLRSVADAHRNAIADASQHVLRMAAKGGSKPNPDELTRTLEALSLAPELPEAAGRLTRPLQPAGFEALAGVVPASIPARTKRERDGERQEAAAGRQDERDARRAEANLRKAEAALARATAAETKARLLWERAKRDVDTAQRVLTSVRSESKG